MHILWILPFWILFFQGCSDDSMEEFTGVIEARTFRVNTPPGWTLEQGAGYDTYVGSIVHGDDTIFFDQGFNSFGGLEKIQPDDQTIYMKYLVVDGLPALLRKESIGSGDREQIGVTLYIDAGDFVHLNRLYFFDPSNPMIERMMIGIMKTHRFK